MLDTYCACGPDVFRRGRFFHPAGRGHPALPEGMFSVFLSCSGSRDFEIEGASIIRLAYIMNVPVTREGPLRNVTHSETASPV